MAKKFKMGVTTIWTYVTKMNQPILWDRYQLKLATEDKWREPGDRILESSAVVRGLPVQVHNPVTGEDRVFRSACNCSAAMGVKTGALHERLKFKDHRVSKDGFMYGYYPLFENQSVPIEKLEPKCYLNLENPKADEATA